MAQKINASTQKFTEIVDFVDNIVVLEGGNACLIIEITASNFALLSKREQDSRVASYASLLNSLSFPIQILIRNKRMDISNYLNELDEAKKNSKNDRLATYISYYRDFVEEIVTVNVVLNKSFFIVVPYSFLEGNMPNASQPQQAKKQKDTVSKSQKIAENAKRALESKSSTVMAQLQKFAVSAKILEKDELVKLFYDIYNQGDALNVEQAEPDTQNAFVATAGGGENT